MDSLEELLNKEGEERDQSLEDVRRRALDGDESMELLLAQYWLHQSEVAETGNESAEEAVKWMIKASRKGSEEATEMLRDCADKDIGITEEIKEEVLWCLQTSQLEKQARQSARKLFRSLNPIQASKALSAPLKSLSEKEFFSGLDLLQISKKEKKFLQKAGKEGQSGSGGEIHEEDFIDSVITKLYGSGRPQVEGEEVSHQVDWEAASWLQKVWKYPTMTLTYIVNHAIDTAGSRGMAWLLSMIPTHQVYMILIFFLYSLISLDVILWILPLFTFYVSFIAMLICTLQMFYSKKKSLDVKAMADMLGRFNSVFKSETAMSSYSWNSLRPYLSFFVALLFTILSLAMADNNWIPCAEITVICAVLTLACFIALSDRYDHLAILSILLDNISTLPVIIEGLPKIPVVYRLLEIVAGSAYAVEVLPRLYLQFGLPSLAYLIVPLLFVRMAMKNSWEGTYRILIPHLVCFFWWRLTMMFYTYSTLLGLVRASVGWISFVIFLPIIGLVFIIWLIYYIFAVLTITNLLKVITTIIMLSIPAGFAIWAKKGLKFKGVNLGSSKSALMKIIMVVLFAASLVPFTFLVTPPERNVHGEYLSWEKYRSFCSQPRWDETNIAESMVMCSQLSKTMVEWRGVVKKIVVKEIDNQAESFINVLPWSLANWLKCTYGEEYPANCNLTSTVEKGICEVNILQGRRCHLGRLNRYMFEMWVQMPIDEENLHDVRVEASHWFKDSMTQIHHGNTVLFRAALKAEIGNVWPVLRLFSVKCVDCEVKIEEEASKFYQQTGWNVFVAIRSAVQAVWNFFMAPVIQFRNDVN